MNAENKYQAYKQASQTVARTRQIVMLYDGVIRFMQQAKEAIERNDAAQRYNLLVRAGEIVMGLQNSLDFDSGGDIARVLYDFYARIDMEILSIHRTNSVNMCDHVVRQFKQMRDAWDRIDREQTGATAENVKNLPDAAVTAAVTTDIMNIALSA